LRCLLLLTYLVLVGVVAERAEEDAGRASEVVPRGLEGDVELVEGQAEHLGDGLDNSPFDVGVVERSVLADVHRVLVDGDRSGVVVGVENTGNCEHLLGEFDDEVLDLVQVLGCTHEVHVLDFPRDELEVVLQTAGGEHAVELEGSHLGVGVALDDDAHLLLGGRRDLLLVVDDGAGGRFGAGHCAPKRESAINRMVNLICILS
jgi:hypothetical protein